jgi:hypothetical protein
MTMPANLHQIVETTTLDAERISALTSEIHAQVLNESKHLDEPNFTWIHPDDLELLFAEYDRRFFDGQIKQSLGPLPIDFTLSKRMTSSGGKTARYVNRRTGQRWFEIGVSTAILFGCFREDDHRPIVASGIICRDRLDALQRVMEHEIVHLIEMLLWEKQIQEGLRRR